MLWKLLFILLLVSVKGPARTSWRWFALGLVCTAGIWPWIVGYHGWPEPLEVVSPYLRGTRLLFS